MVSSKLVLGVLVTFVLLVQCKEEGIVLFLTNMNGERNPPMIFEKLNSTTLLTNQVLTYQTEEFSTNAIHNTVDNTYTYVSAIFQYLVQINVTSGEVINVNDNSVPHQMSSVLHGGAMAVDLVCAMDM